MAENQNTFTFDQAQQIALEYFHGEEMSTSVYLNKYALRDDDNKIIEANPDKMHDRLAGEFARIDSEKYGLNYDERYQVYFNAMKNFGRIVPQGSVMAAVGNPYQIMSASNCVVEQSPEDSISGIFRTAHNLAQLYKRRCGAGFDLSTLRPDGVSVNNAARTTTGAWSFADFFSDVTRIIGQCIAEGERVLTKNGLLPIEEVQPGDVVWTKKGWIKVINRPFNGQKTVFELQTVEGFCIKASADHIFLTENNGELVEKRLGDFEPGDSIILLPGCQTIHGNIIDDLLPPEYVKKAHNNSNRLNENVSIPPVMTLDLSYILGQSYGDGSVEYDKFNEPTVLSIACSHSHPMVQDYLVECIEKTFGITPVVKPGDGAVNKIEIHSKLICHWLKLNGLLKQKSHFINVPSRILRSNTAIQLAFVAGFFDADGTNGKSKKGYTLTTTSLHFAKELQTILFSAGIISKRHIENRNEKGWRNLHSISITGCHAQERLVDYISSGLFPARKIYEKFVSKRDNYLTPFKAKTLGVTHNKYAFVPDDSQYISASVYNKLKKDGVQSAVDHILIRSLVQAITEIGERPTYDLQLEDEHLFWCEGFYTHNSGRRGALMITLDVHHPDVVKFTTMKHDLTKVTGANVSIRLSDEFLKAVEDDTDYEVRWPCNSSNPKIRKRVRARKVWDVIVDSATKSAEPGLIMWTNAVRTLPAHCYPQFESVSTNPSLRGDTKVLTSDGVFEIKDLDGKRIKVKNIIGEDCDADAFCSGKNKQLYKITFNHGQVVYCTKEHKWPILSTLNKVTDERSGKISKKETLNLESGDKIPMVSLRNPINNTNSQFTSEDGFVLGWLYGDGWGTKRINDRIQFGFIFSDEEIDIGHRVLAYTNKLAKIASSLKQDHNSKAVTFSTSDTKVNERFELLKYGKKEDGIPESIWQGNCEFVNGFIDGLFSSDAYFKVNKEKPSSSCIVLTSSRKKLASDVRTLLMFYGIRSSIKETIGKFTRYDLTISGLQALKFANSFTISSNKKNQVLEEIKNLDFQNPHSSRSSYTNNRDYVVVSSVEETDLYEDVYDITVHDETHTFIMESGVTGNCSEIILSASDSCRLITQNLTAYVRNAFEKDAYFDFEAFRSDAALMAQMGDNLVDLELELIERILKTIRDTGTTQQDIEWEAAIWEKLYKAGHDGRRTGLGTHGLADALAQLRLRYDSSEANAMVDLIYANFKEAIYGASIELAKVRGTFPVFDHKIENNNPFITALPEQMQTDLAKYGRRNISMLTQAPTGSVSIISKIGEFDLYNVSSGVEPVFRVKYTRRKKVNPDDEGVRIDFRDANGDSWQEYSIFSGNAHAYLDKFGLDEKTPLPDFFVSSDEIDWTKRIAVQSTEQKHIDHSISSTINLPAGTSNSVVANLYLEAWKQGLKGVTVYVDGSRDGVLVTGEKQALKADNYLVGHYTEAFDKPGFNLWDALEKKYRDVTGNLKRLAIERNQALGNFDWDTAEAVKIPKMNKQDVHDVFAPLFTDPDRSSAPKRPKILPAEVHKIRIDFGDGEPRNAYVTVSFFLGTRRPYEILVQAPYFGLGEKDLQILEVTARSTSMLLRHKVPIMFICEQLDKVGGQYLFSLPTNIARVLRSYTDEMAQEESETKDIEAFDRKNAVPIEKCPKCGCRTYRKTGAACGICENPECAYSGCG
jgi:ribonucleotide reductase alpha subunit